MSTKSTGASSASRLPATATSFIGRRRERATVRAQLGESRLVTLVGTGGVGKTRLALRVAEDLHRTFTNGIVHVSLAPQTEGLKAAPAFAEALGLQGRSQRTTTSSIVDFLRGRAMLVVVDNCEHLVDEVADLVDEILGEAPDVRFLATSREPLRVTGETVHLVPPLTTHRSPDSSLPSEGELLFLDRARAALPGFELDASQRPAVIEIVNKLEGIPLAIELAASRLRSMTAQEISNHLTQRWELLSRGTRTGPDRQRTMAACIEWSYGLCTAAEREAWAWLSVFANGFELDAASAVCVHLEGLAPDLVATLVDKSIVSASHDGPVTRYRMLPPIRQRGLAHLRETGQLRAAQRRHRDWFARLADETSEAWMTPRQVDNINRLRREGPNLAAMLEFCCSDPAEADAGLWVGVSLLEFALANGLLRQGREWFERLLQLSPEPSELRALALRTEAYWAAMQGDVPAAQGLLAQAKALGDALTPRTATLLTQTEGLIALFQPDPERARQALGQSIEELRETGDERELAHSLALMTVAHLFLGDPEEALAAHRECMALTEPVGEAWYRSYSLWIASLATWSMGDRGAALRLQRESLRLRQRTRDLLGIGTSLEAVAWMAAADDPAYAARLLGGAAAIWERIETSTSSIPGLHWFHLACHETVLASLGADDYRRHHDSGRATATDQLIELAMGQAAPASPRQDSSRLGEPSPLTPREREVAALVARGLSNREIAASLVISKRTAETHVDHILTKLGFNARAQIAAWFQEEDRRA